MSARRAYGPDEAEYAIREATTGLPLFAPPQVRTLARRSDPETSRDAALAISERVTALQARVWVAFLEHGPMSAKEVEALPELADLGFSTARKRTGELATAGHLRATGEKRAGSMVYEAVER